jgi:hypothetical protein
LSNKHFAFEVTKKMIDKNPASRPTISDVRAPLREIFENRDIAVRTNEDKLNDGIGKNASHGRVDPSPKEPPSHSENSSGGTVTAEQQNSKPSLVARFFKFLIWTLIFMLAIGLITKK